jgi:hypothetical protein
MQDVDGSTSDMLRSANVTLMHLDQKALTIWANSCHSCMEQCRQVMHLASEAYELLTTDNWFLNDCDEFLDKHEECSTSGKPTRSFATERVSLDSV